MFRRIVHACARLITRNVVHAQRNQEFILDDWTDVPMGCCDCGLFHRFDFSTTPDGKLVIRGRRDFVLTEAKRAAMTFPYQPQERSS